MFGRLARYILRFVLKSGTRVFKSTSAFRQVAQNVSDKASRTASGACKEAEEDKWSSREIEEVFEVELICSSANIGEPH